MSTPPNWALAVAYWLHMVATVTWLGGLSALSLMVIPAAQKTLEAGAYSKFLGVLRRRLQQIGWLSLAVLIATGMFQMSSSPNYKGFLAITNNWAVAILIKHLAIGLLIILSVYSTWYVHPALERLAFLQAAGKEIVLNDLQKLQHQELVLLRANLVISLVVLALTAWARTA